MSLANRKRTMTEKVEISLVFGHVIVISLLYSYFLDRFIQTNSIA